jgi:hypothetical protein
MIWENKNEDKIKQDLNMQNYSQMNTVKKEKQMAAKKYVACYCLCVCVRARVCVCVCLVSVCVCKVIVIYM